MTLDIMVGEKLSRMNNLKIINEIDLPTHWTNNNNTETKYLITKRNPINFLS